ncbi:MAG: hypothetical protein HC877_15295 [Thioploca sp.]|nr:hypothetical protein [Thioploca sp.]
MKHLIITTMLTMTSLWAIITEPGILQAQECTEITNAITWAKQSNPKITHPVTAYFTKHTGYITDPNSPKVGTGQDYCWYAVGQVQINLKPVEHLFGDLQLT